MTELLDVGPAQPLPRPPSAREAWAKRRAEAIAAQAGRCFTCDLPFERLDVAERNGQLHAFCRGHRVAAQAGDRKGQKLVRQREVPGTRRRKAAPIRPAERSWSQGYACALANVHRVSRNHASVQQGLVTAGISLLGLIKAGVKRFDADELLRAIGTASKSDATARGATVQHLRRLISIMKE